MRRLLVAFLVGFSMVSASAAHAQDAVSYDPPDPAIDALVDACFDQEGVAFLPGTDVICYNSAIFPEQYLKLNDMGPASRIIITSPGGNVATARGMSGILDKRGEPVTIAGPCMSACAMVILPGLDDVHVHRTALIGVHGIVMMPFQRWFGWLKNDAEPSTFDIIAAQNGFNFKFAMHSSLTGHMRGHLEAQGVELDFVQIISDQMEDDARAFTACRIDPDQYWGIITPEHLKAYLGDSVTRLEEFVSEWDDPKNAPYRKWGHAIAPRTFILGNYWDEANCGG